VITAKYWSPGRTPKNSPLTIIRARCLKGLDPFVDQTKDVGVRIRDRLLATRMPRLLGEPTENISVRRFYHRQSARHAIAFLMEIVRLEAVP